jgi:hypothetical protein
LLEKKIFLASDISNNVSWHGDTILVLLKK